MITVIIAGVTSLGSAAFSFFGQKEQAKAAQAAAAAESSRLF